MTDKEFERLKDFISKNEENIGYMYYVFSSRWGEEFKGNTVIDNSKNEIMGDMISNGKYIHGIYYRDVSFFNLSVLKIVDRIGKFDVEKWFDFSKGKNRNRYWR